MGKLAKKKVGKYLIIFATFLFAINIIAESQTPRKIPEMWVSKSQSQNRVTNFLGGFYSSNDVKYKLLSTKLGKPETQSFIYTVAKIKNLFQMMKDDYGADFIFLRIYIASYNKNFGGGYFDDQDHNTLKIIFAPANALKKDLGKYYVIDKNMEPQKLDLGFKDNWTSFYIKEKMPYLLKTIDVTAEENYLAGDYLQFVSDTRSIFYELRYIDDFLTDEVKYQDTANKIKISSIQINFAAYSDKGIDSYDDTYKKRLIIQFEFLNSQNKIIYIDDTPHFKERLKATFLNSRKFLEEAAFDHGDLCPPKVCN